MRDGRPLTFLSALAMATILLVAGGCGESDEARSYGYVEGEYVRVASPLAGRLTTLYVQRGDRVQTDTPLFVLEHQFELAVVALLRYRETLD